MAKGEPWFAEYERAWKANYENGLALTTRRDETALFARIERLEEELERLRERLNGQEKQDQDQQVVLD